MHGMGRCPMTNKSISIVLYLGVRYSVFKVNKFLFLDSSMVEHSAVNRGVVGSSPTRGVFSFHDERRRKRADARVGHKASSRFAGPSL